MISLSSGVSTAVWRCVATTGYNYVPLNFSQKCIQHWAPKSFSAAWVGQSVGEL